MRRLLAAAAAVLLAGCAARPQHPDAFTFAVIGDTQYNAEEERVFVEMLERLGRENPAFVIHVGDIKGGGPCTDELYQRRKREYDASARPFIYTPGDNEWTDCRHVRPASDPLERLARLRETFFADDRSLGRSRIDMLVQRDCVEVRAGACACPGLPENRFWYRGGIRFVTLHLPGSENNRGHDAANDEEARCRDEANRQWLEQAVRISERSETRALVIVVHANPWEVRRGHYRPFLQQVERAARRVHKPLLLVHGDSHGQRVDTPFADVYNITRLETFGSPFLGWVNVTVDPDDPVVFRFEPKLYKVVVP